MSNKFKIALLPLIIAVVILMAGCDYGVDSKIADHYSGINDEELGNVGVVSIKVDKLSGSIDGNGWTLVWDYDYDSENYSLIGNTTFTNHHPRKYLLDFRMPIPVNIDTESIQLNGQVYIKLINGPGGGQMTSRPNESVWQLISGTNVEGGSIIGVREGYNELYTTFAHPFLLGGSGAGELNLSSNPINTSGKFYEENELRLVYFLEPGSESSARITTVLFFNAL